MTWRPRAIIVSEPNEKRRQTAREFFSRRAAEAGIDLILSEPAGLDAVIADVTGGAGVDDCIVALGIQAIQQKSLDYLGPGGVANFFGGLRADDGFIRVDARRIHY